MRIGAARAWGSSGDERATDEHGHGRHVNRRGSEDVTVKATQVKEKARRGEQRGSIRVING